MCTRCVPPCVPDVPQEKWGFIVVPQCVPCVPGVFKLKFFLENKTLFLRSPNMNSEKGVTHVTHVTHLPKWLIYNTIYCNTYGIPTCYKFVVPVTHCCAGARGTSRGPWSAIHDSFSLFHGFLLIKASWNNSDKPLRNESVNMSHESWIMARV